MFIAFRLKLGRDDDLISWINNAGEGDRSYHIRETLRRGLFREAAPFYAVQIEPKQVEETAPEVLDLEKNLDEWF